MRGEDVHPDGGCARRRPAGSLLPDRFPRRSARRHRCCLRPRSHSCWRGLRAVARKRPPPRALAALSSAACGSPAAAVARRRSGASLAGSGPDPGPEPGTPDTAITRTPAGSDPRRRPRARGPDAQPLRRRRTTRTGTRSVETAS
jgi:hypothetical protein